MARNLSRNTKLVVSTVAPTGTPAPADSFEVPPLDGYSFTQDTGTQEISLNEAGDTPVRGTQSFNTSINPADVSFTTYIKPYLNGANHDMVERLLWKAFVGTESDNTNVSTTATEAVVSFTNSDKPQLLKLYLYFILDNVTYCIEEFVVNTAEIDFSIDSIAQIAWSGQGKSIVEATNTPLVSGTNYTAAPSSPIFIRNKLNSIVLTDNNGTSAETDSQSGAVGGTTAAPIITTTGDVIAVDDEYVGGRLKYTSGTQNGNTYKITDSTEVGVALDTITLRGPFEGVDPSALDTFDVYPDGHTAETYNVPITGGALTLDNGITFLTAEELGVVNQPIDHFTGARAISGNLTAYLNTGQQNTSDLLTMLSEDLGSVSQDFSLTVNIGGAVAPNVAIAMGSTQLAIPTIATEDVISTEIVFKAQNPNGLDPVGGNEEATITYKAA